MLLDIMDIFNCFVYVDNKQNTKQVFFDINCPIDLHQ